MFALERAGIYYKKILASNHQSFSSIYKRAFVLSCTIWKAKDKFWARLAFVYCMMGKHMFNEECNLSKLVVASLDESLLEQMWLMVLKTSPMMKSAKRQKKGNLQNFVWPFRLKPGPFRLWLHHLSFLQYTQNEYGGNSQPSASHPTNQHNLNQAH